MKEERKPDGGLAEWIEVLEDDRGDNSELLCLLLELRRHRESNWQQRAEAAEAKLAELAKQKPIGWLNDAYLGRGVIDGEVGEDDFGPGYIPIYRHPFNDVPTPSADLADLVPDEWTLAQAEKFVDKYTPPSEEEAALFAANEFRAAILRNIEEKTK